MLGVIYVSFVLVSFFVELEIWWGYVKDLVYVLGRFFFFIYWILFFGEMGFFLVFVNFGGIFFF